MPTPTFIVNNTDPYDTFLPPGYDSNNVRDPAWSFYHNSTRWACLRRKFSDPTLGDSFSPAMFRSDDNGATWANVGQSSAPKYGTDWTGAITGFPYGTNSPLIVNSDAAQNGNPTSADHITFLIQAGVIITGPFSGETFFIYADFSFLSQTWGTPYGLTRRGASHLETVGYFTPVFFYSQATGPGTEIPEVEGAASLDGLGGYGSDNLVVGLDGTTYVIAATNYPGLGTGYTAPDAFSASNLRSFGNYLLLASDALGTFGLWSRDLSDPHKTWTKDVIHGADFGTSPWILEGGDYVHVFWLGSDSSTFYRAYRDRNGWHVEALYADVNTVLGPNVCRNPILGGVDVTYMASTVGGGAVITFHVDDPGPRNRYYSEASP